MRALADRAPRTESTTRKPASYRPSSNAAYSIPKADSAARVNSTARRFGACGLTTNLSNKSAILASAPLLQEYETLHHALAQGISCHRGDHVVRRPVLSAATLCLSRGRRGLDQHRALQGHGAPPLCHHDHWRLCGVEFWRNDAGGRTGVPHDALAADQNAAGAVADRLPRHLLPADAGFCA